MACSGGKVAFVREEVGFNGTKVLLGPGQTTNFSWTVPRVSNSVVPEFTAKLWEILKTASLELEALVVCTDCPG